MLPGAPARMPHREASGAGMMDLRLTCSRSTASTPRFSDMAGLRRTVTIGVAALLAAVLLFYSLRGIEWRQVGRIVANARLSLLAAAAALATLSVFLRAVRWRVLLNAEGSISVAVAFWATAAGLFGNNFLPARGGEFVRTVMISSHSGLSKAYVLATPLSEKVADALVLVLISAAVLLTLPHPPGWLARAARPMAIAALLGAIAIGALPLVEPLAHRVIAAAPALGAWRLRLLGAIQGGLQGIRAFHDVGRLSAFFSLTLVIWCIDAIGTVVGCASLGFRIPLAVAFLLIAGLGLGSALPSTPGYVGIYQFVAVSVLTPFGVSRTNAIAYIIVAQGLFWLIISFWGSIGLWRHGQTRYSS